jgi:hypothetical protein
VLPVVTTAGESTSSLSWPPPLPTKVTHSRQIFPNFFPGFKPAVNETWFFPNVYGADIYAPWNNTAFNNYKAAFMANPKPDRYMCYAVMPADFTDTTDEYTVSKDPDDPVFYSTCYYRYLGNTFASYPDTTVPSIAVGPWRFNDKCVSCTSQSSNMYPDVTPKWSVQEMCVNCDVEPRNITRRPTVANLIEVGVKCDGTANSWSKPLNHTTCANVTATPCVKQLVPIGRAASENITYDECYLMASNEPTCSNTFMWQVNSTQQKCYCYLNNACCLSCSRRADGTLNTYEIKAAADPTCATGTLSTDGKSCCSGSCGAGNCLPKTGVVDQVGFCCSTCITRPCSQYGPPCTMP